MLRNQIHLTSTFCLSASLWNRVNVINQPQGADKWYLPVWSNEATLMHSFPRFLQWRFWLKKEQQPFCSSPNRTTYIYSAHAWLTSREMAIKHLKSCSSLNVLTLMISPGYISRISGLVRESLDFLSLWPPAMSFLTILLSCDHFSNALAVCVCV